MTAPDMSPRIGDRLGHGRFELLAKLGEGGMSLVFRAYDHALRREVALKLLQPRYVGRPEREQRLLNEAAYLRRLQGQPRIVELVDAGVFEKLGGWPWLATRVLEGKTLNWLFVGEKLECEAILTIVRQIAECIEACHRCGIVNRYLTPTNVMVVDPATHAIELFDFSHAGSLDAPQVAAGMPGRLTGEFDAPGSVGYMSPEQACKAPPDPMMDVFGFGALIYELVTRQTPYAEIGDREAFIQAQSQGRLEPLRLHAWAYDVPEGLGELVHACTQRSPLQRPTMGEVVRRLEQLGGVAARPGHRVNPSMRRKLLLPAAIVAVVGASLAVVAWQRLPSSIDANSNADVEPAVVADELAPVARNLPRDPSVPEAPSPANAQAGTHVGTGPPIVDPRPEPPTKAKHEPRVDDGKIRPNPPTMVATCDGVVSTAKAAAGERDWETALRLAGRTECWPSKRERLRLEVSAYASLGRWADCVRVGGSSNDPEIQARVTTCERSR
jgi:serine/threonine protein kinase